MKERLVLALYGILLPLFLLASLPGWILKMIRRGGLRTGLHGRLGIYTGKNLPPRTGAIHIHAISVGETMLALKLIRAWLAADPTARFVLATGTSTGHQTATRAAHPSVFTTYSPVDLKWSASNYLRLYQPSEIILIEGEIWPNLLRLSRKNRIRVSLANARTSPRSARRFRNFASLLQPFFRHLTAVCIQEERDRPLWQALGVPAHAIHLTGSLKFDPSIAPPPSTRPDFSEILNSFGSGKHIILAASTFPGEEALIARAILDADPAALPVIVPRHAERRAEVLHQLDLAGFQGVLRTSSRHPPPADRPRILIIDTTGELPSWTALADVVIIGKSFLATGGQNPAEAIAAGKPLILGPHMENFQPLAADLIAAGAALTASDSASITAAILTALDPAISSNLTSRASAILARHAGAALRHLNVLRSPSDSD